MKPRSTVTALLAITASLLAAKAEAGRTKRMASPAGSAVSSQVTAASTLKQGRKAFAVRLKTVPSS